MLCKDIILETENKLIRLNQNDIVYLKAIGCYTEIHLRNESTVLISQLLKNTERLIDTNSFCRCHKSYIINLHYFQEMRKGNKKEILMQNDEIVPLSSRKVNTFKIAVRNFVTNLSS